MLSFAVLECIHDEGTFSATVFPSYSLIRYVDSSVSIVMIGETFGTDSSVCN